MFEPWFRWLAVIAVCFLSAKLAAANDILTAHEHELLEALAQDVIDPHQVLQALLGESGRFHSGDHEPDGFSVEILGFNDKGEEVRLIGDSSDTGLRSLEFLSTSRISFRHNRNALHYRSKLWSVSETGNVRVSWDSLDGKQSGNPGVDVSIAGMIGPEPEWTSVEYQSGLSELRASDKANRTLIVRLRSPNDAARFGSSISHASLWKDGLCQRELRRPVRLESTQRLPKLGLQEFQHFHEQVTSDSKAVGALQSWFKNSGVPDSKALKGELAAPELLLALGSLGKPALLPFQELAINQMGLEKLSPAILQEKSISDLAREHVESRLFQESRGFFHIVSMLRYMQDMKSAGLPIVDDAVIRNWQFETDTSLVVLHPFCRNFVESIVRREDVRLLSKARCAYALGRVGRPATLTIPRFDDEDQKTIQTWLSISWEQPYQEQSLQACRKIVKDSPVNSLVGIAKNCLLLRDQYDRIQDVEANRWWNRNSVFSVSNISEFADVAKAEILLEAFEKDDRWSNIWEMSRFPTSRRFLRSRLESNDPLPIRRLVLTALQHRALAAQNQQRFDFMSRAECEEILAIPDFEVSGRDSEAGPARPFPSEP